MNDIIKSLSDQVIEAYESNENQELITMWKNHNNGIKSKKIPVNVHLFKGQYTNIWKELIPIESIKSKSEIEAHIELQLRQQLFKYNTIKDDDVIIPTIWVTPVFINDENNMFGVNTKIDHKGISYKAHTIINSIEDIKKLKYPTFDIDEEKTKIKLAKYNEAVSGRLPVKLKSNFLGESPFDIVCKFREMTQLMYDCIDNPSLVHELMNFVTEGHIKYHLDREKKGYVEPEESYGFRVHVDDNYGNEKLNTLKDSWAYISAQAASMLSPDMFAEFVFPYNNRLANIYGKVYYHGCEDLTKKADLISEIKGLKRFHVSPWTNLEKIVEKFDKRFVLEVHVHPTDTIFSEDELKMKQDIQRIIDIAKNCCIDINLSDIETVRGDPMKLIRWSKIAKEVTELNS